MLNDPACGLSDQAGPLVVPLASVGLESIPLVGGKNASLGELIQHLGSAGVQVPAGFATTTLAYRLFLKANGLEEPLRHLLESLDATDLAALRQAGAKVRALMEGRYHVTADDLKALAKPILRHRVLPNYYAESDGITIDQILDQMLEALPVPSEVMELLLKTSP